MIHHISRMPTMVPITMPAMAPPSRPELEVEPVLVLASTRTVVVGCWRVRRRVSPPGRVGVGAMMTAACSVLAGCPGGTTAEGSGWR
jgi:hypothetical protein